jgi:hypothetical protein
VTPLDYLSAARVPDSVRSEVFGPWRILRRSMEEFPSPVMNRLGLREAGEPARYTLLLRHTMASLHQSFGDVVMEDSRRELRRHLPIWLNARGSVLVTGLGLGCVVRGLLAKPDITSIDVVELDRRIIERVGPEFESNPRVRLHLGDAFDFPLERQWDFAWHDIWTEDAGALTKLHVQLMARFRNNAKQQGAWGTDKRVKRLIAKVPEFSLGLGRRASG